MKIISEVRQYDSFKSMNCAVGQFLRYNHPEVSASATSDKDRHFCVQVVRNRYPFVESVLRKLKKMERKAKQEAA